MKVIGSGFGRTGTMSMKAALEQLGFGPCYHMDEVALNKERTEAWYHISQGKPANWQKIFQNYESAVDFPASVLYKEILAAFPEAKVVHTVREPEKWYASTMDTIYLTVGSNVFPKWVQRMVKMFGQWVTMSDTLIWNGLFEGQFENRQRAIEIFNERTEEVKRTVPADQLLVFSVKEGWEPLCQFLGVPVPDTPFPHVNDKKTMRRQLQAARIILRLAPALLVGIIFAIGIVITGLI
ncbi:MAG: sulfotransferase family protein [Ardenticatenaceae bacterium]|nr:sulfotransferase family protein [Ardenticatenaceae bacterium]